MILDETTPALFYQGEDIYRKIKKALSCSHTVTLDISMWNTPPRVVYTVWASGEMGNSFLPVYDKPFTELLSWLKQKELLLQKIELP